mmetsp:Transcript_2209/g.6658  ORF Transcript_2209/g.6658 Transcript_2209/m.6658 type:complete len:303 (-) Transcript_2209:450-1358(-)
MHSGLLGGVRRPGPAPSAGVQRHALSKRQRQRRLPSPRRVPLECRPGHGRGYCCPRSCRRRPGARDGAGCSARAGPGRRSWRGRRPAARAGAAPRRARCRRRPWPLGPRGLAGGPGRAARAPPRRPRGTGRRRRGAGLRLPLSCPSEDHSRARGGAQRCSGHRGGAGRRVACARLGPPLCVLGILHLLEALAEPSLELGGEPCIQGCARQGPVSKAGASTWSSCRERDSIAGCLDSDFLLGGTVCANKQERHRHTVWFLGKLHVHRAEPFGGARSAFFEAHRGTAGTTCDPWRVHAPGRCIP